MEINAVEAGVKKKIRSCKRSHLLATFRGYNAVKKKERGGRQMGNRGKSRTHIIQKLGWGILRIVASNSTQATSPHNTNREELDIF